MESMLSLVLALVLVGDPAISPAKRTFVDWSDAVCSADCAGLSCFGVAKLTRPGSIVSGLKRGLCLGLSKQRPGSKTLSQTRSESTE